MRCCVVQRDESAARDTHEVKSPEREVASERVKVVRCSAGLRTSRGVGLTPSPSPAIECDDTIASAREGVDLRCPALAGSSDRVHQHDRFTGAAGIGEPESYAGDRRELASGRWCLLCGQGYGHAREGKNAQRESRHTPDQGAPPRNFMRSRTSS